MTHKKYAKELFDRFYKILTFPNPRATMIDRIVDDRNRKNAKQCALICVAEMIKTLQKLYTENYGKMITWDEILYDELEELKNLKQEIEK